MEPKAIYIGEHKLNKEFIHSVGRLTINFAELEYTLAILCGQYLEGEFPAEIVTSEYSFKQLVNVTRCILLEVNKSDGETYKEIFGRITKAEEDRNRIIHSFYGSTGDDDNNRTIRGKYKNKPKGHEQTLEVISVEFVNKTADEIGKISQSLVRLLMEKQRLKKMEA